MSGPRLCLSCGQGAVHLVALRWVCARCGFAEPAEVDDIVATIVPLAAPTVTVADSVVNRFCVHGRSTTADPCPACDPYRRH